VEAGNLVRTKAPRTQCEDQEAVFWTVGRLVERADVLGGETRRIGIVIGIVRPVELLVEAISWVDDGPFAPDQMSVPVRDDEVNPAFGLTAIELVVETVERCPAASTVSYAGTSLSRATAVTRSSVSFSSQ